MHTRSPTIWEAEARLPYGPKNAFEARGNANKQTIKRIRDRMKLGGGGEKGKGLFAENEVMM